MSSQPGFASGSGGRPTERITGRILSAATVILLLVTGCSSGRPLGNAPNSTPAEATGIPPVDHGVGSADGAATADGAAPAPPEYLTPTAESAPGSSTAFAPGLLPGAGAPAPGALSLRKLVRVPEGAPLYRGPGDWYGTHDDGAPAELPYGTLWNGWLGLRLERGLGWIPAANRLEMRDQDGDGARYVIEPGRAWTMTAPDGLKIDVRRKATGLIQIDVLGSPEAPGPLAYSGGSMAIEFPSYRPTRGRIDIGEDGLRGITVSADGIVADFDVLPGVGVLANMPGSFSLELRPRIIGIQVRQEGDTVVVALPSQGYLPPLVQRNGQVLTLRLQGAQLAADLREGAVAIPEALRSALPEAPQLRILDDGVSLQMRTDRPHRVRQRRNPAQLELLLLKPGLAGKRIAIDPGHGGRDTGTATPWGVPEKTLNFAVSRALERRLQTAGAEVLMTRYDDTDAQVPEAMRQDGWAPVSAVRELSTRSAISIWWDADVLVSVHHNGGGPASRGTEVYWHTNLNGDRSVALAGLMQDALVRELDTLDRGVIRRPFGMVRAPHAPAALVEIGFLTNDAEARFMAAANTQERAAAAMVQALAAFFAPIP